MTTPLKISRTRYLDAPPDAVWAALAKFDQISSWADNVDHSAYTTTATEGVGAARRVKAGPMTILETITEWEPDQRLTYSLVGLPPIVRSLTNSWQLEPSGGGTRATITSTIEPRRSILGRVGALLFSRVLANAATTLLSGLAAHLRMRAR